ncbi:MAG: hypothetical protein KGI06_02420 [Candidatus Micrarchaeota archaeon]|nr:hypothetical protein [Candidatus Micrarchaeota archaeon]
MKNFLNKIFVKTTSIAYYAKYVLLALSVLGLFGTLATAQFTTGAGSALCVVFNSVRNIIFLLGLTLMILGAALYAGANIMPASAKGGFQGYGMAMIIGGVVGVAIAVAAPFVLNLLIGIGGGGVLGSTGSQNIVTACAGIGTF